MAQQVPNKGKGLTIGGTYSSTNPTPTSHYETLDPKFYVRPRSFFKEGKVILFTEAAGTTATGYNPCISVVSYGQSVHTQIRRFIVVRAKREFCFACPIFTYNNQGTLKPGVRAKEHAIAYTVGREPTLLPGEATLEKSPIPIVNVAGEPAFHIASRIYFGIHHPIQYNVKVKELGDVPPDWVPTLRQYWTSENDQATGQDIDVTASATYDAETPLPPT
ncbi:hypothetical protein BDV95DRAFT_501386 [Massariosphaeria phaeospora]|uniref:DUF6590 domain-containing protein n=1 Tax=Massariosphaeria phaeospora TaxID=100035 RepID=A0A7C8I3B6_9PLEO|nr:hypothetical protein BDV95DRAFT_501386 [Massariosphaeria phaeospora]